MSSIDVPAGRPVAVAMSKAILSRRNYVADAGALDDRFAGVPPQRADDGGERPDNASQDMYVVS